MNSALRILLPFVASLSLTVTAIGQSAPAVHLDAEGLAPRPIEQLTGTSLVRFYAQAWQEMAVALESNRDDLITDEFTGFAKDHLLQRISGQRSTGLHVHIVDHGHHLKALFYSTDGAAMELRDHVELEIQTYDGSKLIDSELADHDFMVLMTPGADRWYVRDLEDVSGQSF